MRFFNAFVFFVASCAIVFSFVGARAADETQLGSDVGRSAARALVEYESPNICAIVLERARCRVDFRHVRFAMSASQVATVRRWLVDGDVEHRLQTYSAYVPPEALWTDNVAFAWWVNASAVGMLEHATGARIATYRTRLATVLRAHQDSAPAELGGASDRAALERIVPVSPVPAISDPERASVSMQVGVYAETLAEMLESPNALALPDGRAFALAVVDHEEAFDRTFGDHYSFASIRTILGGPLPREPASIDSELRRPLARWETIVRTDRVRADSFLFGVLCTRIAYDAAVYHHHADDRALRIFARSLRAAQTPSLAAHRAAIALLELPIRRSRWAAVNAAATRVVEAIVRSQPPTLGLTKD